MSNQIEIDTLMQQLTDEREAQKLLKRKAKEERALQKIAAREEQKRQNLIERKRQTALRKEARKTVEGRLMEVLEKQEKQARHEALRQKGEHAAATLYPQCIPIRISNGNIAQPGTAVGIMVDICRQHHGPKPHVSSGRAVVRHTCVNDSMARNGFVCGNPDHIEWSTQRQNFLDAINGPHSNVNCPHCGTALKVNALGFHMYHNHPHLFNDEALPLTENTQGAAND